MVPPVRIRPKRRGKIPVSRTTLESFGETISVKNADGNERRSFA